MAKFSERLRLLRKQADLSQQELANLLGSVSKSSINMYERGEREPGIETLEAIADFFNVDLDYLLGKSDTPNKSYSERGMSFDELKKLTDEFFTRLDVIVGFITIERRTLLAIADILDDEIDLFKEDFVTFDNYSAISEKMLIYTESLRSKVENASLTVEVAERLDALINLLYAEIDMHEKLPPLLLPEEDDGKTNESDCTEGV